jgi:hypothetical protein
VTSWDFVTRDKLLEIIKQHGPLTVTQVKRMIGIRAGHRAWRQLKEDGCIAEIVVDNPLSGIGCRPLAKAYKYVKNPSRQKKPANKKQIERAARLLVGNGWRVTPPEVLKVKRGDL